MLLYVFIIILVYIFSILALHFKYPEMSWDWDNISIKELTFPKEFKWGTATASHQVEGNSINNWSKFEREVNSNGDPRISGNQRSGDACDHWNRYPEDILLIKNLGVSHYRFSIEWSKVQPSQDTFDNDAISHYHAMIDTIIDHDLIPVLTLHHFTHPLWFDDLGAFEKSENIKLFVIFCERIFEEYSGKVPIWCTINEPAVVSTQGYFSGIFPPGKKDAQLSAVVLKNLLEAHVQSYHCLKKLENGDRVKIGIVKNINQFDPWRRWNLLDWIISGAVNQFFNISSVQFLSTGKFKIHIPGLAWIKHENEDAINSTDFFGLNYYSHNHLKVKLFSKELFSMEYKNNDILTDMPYTIYPEGIYRAIKYVSILNVPIMITENGIADHLDDRRELYIKRYLYSVSKAIKDGYNVVGYFYWSFMDNFEWAFGYDMKFGLYSVDFKTQKRELRKGANAFIDIVKNEK